MRGSGNWGRWGQSDEVGAVNLITSAKRIEACQLVRTGRAVSLSYEIRARQEPSERGASVRRVWAVPRENDPRAGALFEYQGVTIHGVAVTHVDALNHAWGSSGGWNGRSPEDIVDGKETSWGGVQNWHAGIVTRGICVDLPRFRGEPYVSEGRPVEGEEIERALLQQGVEARPGDALVICSGRTRWDSEHPPWGEGHSSGDGSSRPGVGASCLSFFRSHDIAVVAWDMHDVMPNEASQPWGVHAALFTLGICLVDNCMLEDLSQACAEEERYEFMFVLAPLRWRGGSGSPVNPLAVF